nr:unnamed protein product [Digitaria exilis]
MDSQSSTAKRYLECMFFDESLEAKALPLSLLKYITNDFSDNLEIGRGGSAVVYKGLLENGEVAVKKLFQTSDIDDIKFHGEVDCLIKAKHKNIVRFLGYCSDTQGQIEKHNGKSVMAEVLERWWHKVEKSQKEQQLEQIRLCTKVGQRCLDYDPAKRPSIQSVINVLEQTETKKLRTETGASSSMVLQASSVVGETASIGNFIMEAHWRDPKNVATTFKMVTQAICEYYAQGRTNVSLEDLHSCAYNMVLYKNGEELYSVMEAAMALEVHIICRSLDAAPADSTDFLQRLLAMWKHHIRAVNFIRENISMSMDRTFIPTNHKTPIYELGLRLWRDNIARSDKIRARLIEAVKQRRGGEDELVPGVNDMLTELGADVMDVPCLCFRDGAGELHAAGP